MRILKLLSIVFTLAFTTAVWAQDIGNQITSVKPKGNGPFPTVILMHSTAGVGSPEKKWSKWLVANGFAAVTLKHARRIKGSSKNLDSYEKYVPARVAELNRTNAWVRAQPWSNGKVSVIGRSHGGWAVIDALKAGMRFSAAVASAPRCDGKRATSTPLKSKTPLLIISGTKDKVVPQGPCVQFARIAGRQVSHKQYSAGHHLDVKSKRARNDILVFLLQ